MKKVVRWMVLGIMTWVHIAFFLFMVLAIAGLVANIVRTFSRKKSGGENEPH